MPTLLVEGWRAVAHSYAIVNQHQLLELATRPHVRVYHRDMPYLAANWPATAGLLTPAQEAVLATIPPPPADLRPDAVLRTDWPHRFDPDPQAGATFVFGTTEFGMVEPAAIASGRPPAEILPATPCRIVTPSNWARQGWIASGAPPDRVHLVPHGVDCTVFVPPDDTQRQRVRRQLGWDGRFVLLNVSAMTPNKGIHFLLKAAAALAPEFPHLLVCLKGSDALYQSQQFAGMAAAALSPDEGQRLGRRVMYLGEVLTTERLVRLYQGADAYVAPYRAEGFNLPVLEAGACGLPVLCTAGGATDDFVHESFAWRIPSTLRPRPQGGVSLEVDLEQLVSMLRRLITDPTRRPQVLAQGPAYIRQHLTWRHAVDRLLTVLFPGL